MKKVLIWNATIVNENVSFTGSVLIEGMYIKNVFSGDVPEQLLAEVEVIDATGKILIPGVIDDQVHFREPGLTHKGTIFTESRAAVAGGITSYMEMPNTKPPATTIEELDKKFDRASEMSIANYSFYIGATNENVDELQKINPRKVCGIKLFMGSSTGNMLVDNEMALTRIFAETDSLIATHCESEQIIQRNITHYTSLYGNDLPIKFHPLIRSEEACYVSSAHAVELAEKYNSKLHILHISTAKELSLFDAGAISEKNITAEVCVHHLWFDDNDYETLGNRIKWNPAIKTQKDKEALLTGLLSEKLDIVATDHAPHLLTEKEGSCLQAASGGPLVQHSLLVMLEMNQLKKISLEKIVEKMCHNPALLFKVSNRGFVREGYFADLVLIDPNASYRISSENILSKCAWSPFEGMTFSSKVEKTFVNGNLVYDNGLIVEGASGMELFFE